MEGAKPAAAQPKTSERLRDEGNQKHRLSRVVGTHVCRSEGNTMSFRAFSTALWYASALFIFGIAVEIIIFRNGTPPIIGSLFTRPNFIDNLPPVLILLLFVWVLFELGIKQRQIRREHSATCQISINPVPGRHGFVCAKGFRPPGAPRHSPRQSHHRMQSARSFKFA